MQTMNEPITRSVGQVLDQALQRQKQGDVEFAYKTYRQVLAQYPEHPLALHYLGLVAQQVGRGMDAEKLLRRSIELAPDDPRTHNHLGQVLVSQGRLSDAIASFRRALQVDATHADSANNLANALAESGEATAAIDLYRRLLESQPRSAAVLYNLANALKNDRDFEQAAAHYAKAIECQPTHLLAHLNLAMLSEQMGRFEAAADHYLAVLQQAPDHSRALSALLSIPGYEPEAAQVQAATRLLAGKDLESEERVRLHSGVGKYLDRRQEFDQAFDHFTAANSVLSRRCAPYDPRETTEQFDRIIRTFSADYFAKLPARAAQGEHFIFIVGMPRSGTTLTEQILASHPAVYSAGESRALPELVKGFGHAYPEALDGMPAAQLDESARRYQSAIEQHATPDAQRVIDKLHLNFMQLGLIATLFPGARVIHCQRDPLDTGLSCFIERFDLQRDFTSNLLSFGHYFLQYQRLMRHWRAVLPLRMRELQYETLISNQEEQTRALLAYLDLPWDSRCLQFHTTPSVVRTPSRWQVRQAMYTSSIGRWRNYAAHLQPLQRLLEEGKHETAGPTQ